MTNPMDSVAIIGYSFKLPGGCHDDSQFWELLENGRNVMSPWPKSRANMDAFYEAKRSRENSLQAKGAHFVNEDPAVFDAPFFAISSREAESMDPQQRWLLEASYQAFENAGIPAEKAKGTETSVFVASMATDHLSAVSKDPDTAPVNAATGTSASIHANKLSWYFDLKGPSIQLNTACSSSMIAVDLACQSLRSGQSSMSVAAGVNVLLNPESSIYLSSIGLLSPDSLCYSFDERANGYSRGEGVIVIIMKRLDHAIRNGDMIRAVIRGTDSNQDGYTPGITQPSAHSQEALIRKVYKKNNLDFNLTRYIEAHGTGTQVGDTTEMTAIGRVFRSSRSSDYPLYVGSVKSNIGHLEGGSGLAGIMKGIIMLEKGLIPPTALFQKLNPRINARLYNIKVLTSVERWPTAGLRRISINSFGFGGSNGHLVMDDAYHSLESLCLRGVTRTLPSPSLVRRSVESKPNTSGHRNGNYHPAAETNENGSAQNAKTNEESLQVDRGDKLLVWTARDEAALKRLLDQYSRHYDTDDCPLSESLEALSYTLAARRSIMSWRSFTVADNEASSTDISRSASNASRTSRNPALAFVFTGQGAQYVNMGLQLLKYAIFKSTLTEIDCVFAELGAEWSLFDKIHSHEDINKPQFSQPLCTALQIALVELLATFSITPSATMGHSSGEIASAYCAGALSLRSACNVAYHRGRLAGKLAGPDTVTGAMISVNLQEDKVSEHLVKAQIKEPVHVACVNSPGNVTLSGSDSDIDLLKIYFDNAGIFAQKLKTGVAYHSPQMQQIAKEYLDSMGTLEAREGASRNGNWPLLVSSVTGQVEARKRFTEAAYWVENMTGQVRFSDALNYIAEVAPESDGLKVITDYVEVGPHAALKRPVNDTLSSIGNGDGWRYQSLLLRSSNPVKSVMGVAGRLFAQGYDISITAINQQQDLRHPVSFLSDTPRYPFDRSQLYWHESRISRGIRLRQTVQSSVLGFPASDWNPLEPRWRKILSTDEMPWISDHVIEDTIYFPATGSLAMALEAARQAEDGTKVISGYRIRDAVFKAPIVIPAEKRKTEVVTQLRRLQQAHTKASPRYDVRLFTCEGNLWNECLSVSIHIEYEGGVNEVNGTRESLMAAEELARTFSDADAACTQDLSQEDFQNWLSEQGLNYGKAFSLAQNIRYNGGELCMASVDVGPPMALFDGPFHPAVLDASCQICFVSPSTGLSKKLTTIIPHKISAAWVSASGWQHPDTQNIRTMVKSSLKPVSMGINSSFIVLADNGNPLCHVENIEMLPVKGGSNEVDNAEKSLIHSITWKPHLSLLSADKLQSLCKADTFDDDEVDEINYRVELKNTCLAAIKFHIKVLQETDWSAAPPHMKRYVSWMERQLQKHTVETLSEVELNKRLSKLRELRPASRLFVEIAENLLPIVRGETDVVSLLFSTTLAQDLYDATLAPLDNDKLESYVELLAHETPEQRILEVGAGTGSVTKTLLNYLQRIEDRTGGIAFSEYTYTDVSSGFFEKAQERFATFQERMSYNTLDLEADPLTQGYKPATYDVVFAGNVLHATNNLSNTLQYIQKLLKPGGRLVMHETTAPECFQVSFGFGPLAGWWRGEEESRQGSPILSLSEWDLLLRQNGFSGSDLAIRDFHSDDAHWGAMVMSTRSSIPDKSLEATKVLLVVDELERNNTNLSSVILHRWTEPINAFHVDVVSLGQVDEARVSAAEHIVFLEEQGRTFLDNLSEAGFLALRMCIQAAKNILWVSIPQTDGTTTRVLPAFSGLKDGFLRTIRSEYQSKRVISLTFEDTSLSLSRVYQHVTTVFLSAFEALSPEDEYIVQKDKILTGRLIQESAWDRDMKSSVVPQVIEETLKPGPPLKVDVEKRGSIETLRYIEDLDSYLPLGATEVEVEAKAWSLNFRDVFLALGRLEDEEGFGSDCSGIVTRVGSSCTSFKPGDRVIMAGSGCMRTFPREDQDFITAIPDDLSHEDACSILNAAGTSYYSLVDVARLQKGEKVLIHSGSGATGQLAIQVAQMVGAEVFTTVGHEYKKHLLMDEYKIPEDHIFYSRDTSFVKGLRRATGGYGVDVVLNSLVGEGLVASWECIAPHGRFIEIGKIDINMNSSLPMAYFAKNVTFAAVDLRYMALHRKEKVRVLLPKVMQLVEEGKIYATRPVHIYGLDSLQDSFRFLQSGRNTGRIVIKLDPSTKFEKQLLNHRSWALPSDATYIIVGGLGGIGRSILQWLAKKGAKHLLVPTRSGVASNAAREAVDTLVNYGVNISIRKCDVSSAESLKNLLEEVKSTMPPIQGCINGAMVLQDSIYENMTYKQWQATIRSKVDTSLNLHNLLGDGLSFFIMLASAAGIIGNISQSNYAAGSTFQDSLAHYRNSKGQRSTAIDLGLMRTIGIVAETASLLKNFEKLETSRLGEVTEAEFLTLMDICCKPPATSNVNIQSQISVGLATPVDLLAAGLEMDSILQRPLFAHFSRPRGIDASSNADSTVNFSALFKQATSSEERVNIVTEALATKLARALTMNVEEVETDQPIHAYGVDSLVAIELRNWISKEFGASIPVFEIVGGKSSSALADLVTKISQIAVKTTA